MRSVSNGSNILVCIATESKIPKTATIEMPKKKKSAICAHEKSRAFKKGELKAILNTCVKAGSTTKLAAFEVGQKKATKKAAIVKAQLIKFKAGLSARKQRDAEKVELQKAPSKQTPKGTIAKAKEPIVFKSFTTKKDKRKMEQARIRLCKQAKLARAA